MKLLKHGKVDLVETQEKGREVTFREAMQIANAAQEVIKEDNARCIRIARIKTLRDGWHYIFKSVAEWLPSENHALVAIESSEDYGNAKILVGNAENVNLNTLFCSPQVITKQRKSPFEYSYWIVDLTK